MTAFRKLSRLGSPAVVFAVAVGLRLALALVNRESNDDHVEVVRRILEGGWHLPDRYDCWECFQPKLYHLTIAALSLLLHVTSRSGQVVLGQLVNTAAGAATLVIAWRTLRTLPVAERSKRSMFGVLALNPALIGINSQATNDSFAILFGTAAFSLCMRFIHRGRGAPALGVILVLGALSKGNGLVAYVLCMTASLLAFWWSWRAGTPFRAGRRLLLGVGGVTLFFFATTPFLGPYAHYYQKYGSPFVINMSKYEPPMFFTEKIVDRPGITSIVHGYFTFRIGGLLEVPTIVTSAKVGAPRHRTSFFTTLYGTGSSILFPLYPPSWSVGGPAIPWLERAIFTLMLVPLGFLLVGFATTVLRVGRTGALRIGELRWRWAALWTAGYLLFAAKYSYDYRDFSTMKAIFVFPALLAIASLGARGASVVLEALERRGRWGGRLARGLEGAVVALVVADVIEVASLIGRLF